MEEHGFHDDGWYPHDGEGKIGNCTGPGCDCDEKNYGYHSSRSNGGISTFGAILCTIGGFVGASVVFTLFGVENPPMILVIILWAFIGTVLSIVGSNHGL